MILHIILLILLLLWPGILAFVRLAWYDFRVWYIQYRINRLVKRRILGGRVKDSLKFYRLIKKANKLDIKLNITIDSPGSASCGVMNIKIIKCQ